MGLCAGGFLNFTLMTTRHFVGSCLDRVSITIQCKHITNKIVRFYPSGDGWSADEAAFRLGLPGCISTKYNYKKPEKESPPDLQMSDEERFSKYVADCVVFSFAQKFWIKKVLEYEIDATWNFRGLRALLCEFSGKNLVFQSKYIDRPSDFFNQHIHEVDFDLWPSIECEYIELQNILAGAKNQCEKLSGPVKKPTERIICKAIGKLSNGVEALRFRHPEDPARLNLEIAAFEYNPVIQEELNRPCITQ